ncbi:unannotated protein [freshwater metagenome]|uniref:Unannotated protein n=1 Tax=freshwater metagenome TaxID=449393 RepID=A0A6J6MVX2_9ZZZZ|nr:hypothetical protein [Actinomycetota bacterium]MSZ59518.1 hypothetical protein [Actinomycetota bacterium]MTA00367.1 hypothetical protein [Actinomycetota bacterium]
MIFQRQAIEIQSTNSYEYQTIQIPKGMKINVVRSMLVERAEMGSWILDRVRIYPDGRHLVTLRRRIIKPQLSLAN